MLKNVLIVLDSFDYMEKEIETRSNLSLICNPEFFYTRYENKLIQFFQKTPLISGPLNHFGLWIISFYYVLTLSFKYKNFDSIIFINPIVGFFYSFLRRFKTSKENIVIAGFLFEPKVNRLYYNIRKKLVNFSYKATSKIIVYGDSEVEYYNKIFPNLFGKFNYVKYGRDFKHVNSISFDCDFRFVGSGGRSNRDFGTLCKAMNLLYKKGVNIKSIIATRPECENEETKAPNVKLQYGIKINQFGAFINKSDFFVLPLVNKGISAGHMSMLEAMSYGKLVVVSDIPSIRDYVDESIVYFYEPGNIIDLSNKLEYLYNHFEDTVVSEKAIKGKKLYEEEYSFIALLMRITNLTIL